MGLTTLLLAVLGGFPPRSARDPEKGPRDEGANVLSDDNSGDESDDEGAAIPPASSRLRSFAFRRRTWSTQGPSNVTSVRFSRTNTATTDSTVMSMSIFTKAKEFIFPPEDPDGLERFVPNYRWTPIISGVVIPFSILLEIPGLTERWYIRTEGFETVETKPNPPLLDSAMAVSIACALIANICLVLRFLEKRVRTTTLLCIIFLTIHDLINSVTVIIFGVQHRFDDGFTYGQAFWLTLCSTITSSITNITLIVDFIRTPDFGISGSGLTRKQRSLVIIVIVLLTYIAFGALVTSFIQNLSFINGLYFTVVTIETIGFGDITPDTTGARIFICFYLAFGVLTIGVAVSMTRETVLEGLEIGYRRRLRKLRLRRREARRFRKWEARWARAVEWRLKDRGLPVWVHDRHYAHEGVKFTGLPGEQDGAGEDHWMRKWAETLGFAKQKTTSDEGHERRATRGHPKKRHLNIDALSSQQLEAAALEAGVPLEMFIDPEGRPTMKRHTSDGSRSGQQHGELNIDQQHLGIGQGLRRTASSNGWPAHPQTPTHAQIGRMAAMVTKFAVAVTGAHVRMMGHAAEGSGDPTEDRQAHLEAAEDAQEAEEEVDEATESPAARKGSAVWFDDNVAADQADAASPGGDAEKQGESSRRQKGDDQRQEQVDVGTNAPVPKWSREMARSAHERSAFSYEHYKEDMASEEKKAYFAKLTVAWSLFLVFWFVGSAIFSATEGWAYGTAMYFCFTAFTTTGYGDFSPQTPAGRSIFVVWALLGVATMTILISVLQEAGSSRYKSALHSRMFDNAVKQFRRRENAETNRIANQKLSPYLRQRARKESTVDFPEEIDDADQGEISPETVLAVKEMAQRDLEELPGEIVRQARTFHQHMQFYVKQGHGIGVGEDGQKEDDDHKAKVPQDLRDLLDEIAKIEGISGRGKREILQDDDARSTLFMLSIERTLRHMINAAEKSMAALAERDALIALQHRRDRRQEESREDGATIKAKARKSIDTPKSDSSPSTSTPTISDEDDNGESIPQSK
ncbi:hypothetical protein EIP91_010926 [Steccherinum ochraceum]|uniref:Potassium channel domain-containing protein n=1 Tax=Steccherinum ochraceum TaxID=92696 RepID=A0A4R0R7X0_9APHY|nr:hypothetical protein EIP91_010926 [Steccherinum ochraceum]